MFGHQLKDKGGEKESLIYLKAVPPSR